MQLIGQNHKNDTESVNMVLWQETTWTLTEIYVYYKHTALSVVHNEIWN